MNQLSENKNGKSLLKIGKGLYDGILEQSPYLLDKYRELKEDPNLLSLTDEIAVTKLLLSSLLSEFARYHAEMQGRINLTTVLSILSAMETLSKIVQRAHDIETKRTGAIGPQQLVAFLIQLKGGIEQDLKSVENPDDALPLINERIAGTKWLGQIGNEELANVIEDADFEVMFKTIRETSDGPVVDKELKSLGSLRQDGNNGKNDNENLNNGSSKFNGSNGNNSTTNGSIPVHLDKVISEDNNVEEQLKELNKTLNAETEKE